ncbi:prepilin-type N-terminal cleavage/methylation domain-containing protein [Candidatus Parcubacteria bacterium]|nr:prepilin-type N-terminal cleavage/methylation domain-containing protein [Candidatus Parcubacteria bacterium]
MKSSQKLTLNRGFSVLEVLIALAILTLGISAAILIVFGNQSLKIDNETNGEALYKAKSLLERARASSTLDFISINTTATTSEDIYSKKFNVADVSPCAKDLTSVVNWLSSFRPLEIQLTTRVTSLDEAEKLGGFCDPVAPESAWDKPNAFDIVSPSDFGGKGTGIAVAYLNGIRYVFLTTDSANKENFWSIDTTDPQNIDIDNDAHGIMAGEKGLNGITIAGNYAYVLNNDTSSHLLVVDITNPLDPKHLIDASSTIIGLTNGRAKSIFYYDKKIYVGTEFVSPTLNNEFYIFDVSTPDDPEQEASIKVNRNVNSIVVRDGIAYLAIGSGSSNPYTPLRAYNVDQNSTQYLQKVGEYATTTNWHGTSLYLLGSKLYFGLERKSPSSQLAPEFLIFDTANLNEPIGSKELNLTPQSSAGVSGVVVQGHLAFLVTTASNARLFILNVSSSAKPEIIKSKCKTAPLPQNATGLVYSDNLLFLSIKDNEAFRIIYNELSCS